MANVPADLVDRRKQSRRKHSRDFVGWPVTVISTSGTYQGKIANISRSGLLIHLSQQLTVGDNVCLAFEVPECQDVLVAKGEVLRAFFLKRGDEQQFSHGIAIKITEISDGNLRFLTGNLVQEWRADYKDAVPMNNDIVSPKASRKKPYLPWALVIILLLPLCYFVYDSLQLKLDDASLIS